MTSLSLTAFAQGWLLMAGLILAIGAQNAQVLRQGLMRRHVAAVVAVCAAGDALLVAAGVFGLGAVLTQSAAMMNGLRYGGAAFVLAYGARSAWRAWRGGGVVLQVLPGAGGLAGTLLTTLGLTFLNPHVYLDTVVLVGAVGAQQPPGTQLAFACGAATVSLMWFVSLGYGAGLLAPWLQRPAVWRAIDASVALIMGVLGLQLLLRPL